MQHFDITIPILFMYENQVFLSIAENNITETAEYKQQKLVITLPFTLPYLRLICIRAMNELITRFGKFDLLDDFPAKKRNKKQIHQRMRREKLTFSLK